MDCELLKILQGSDSLRIIAWKLLFIIFSVTSEDAGFKVKMLKSLLKHLKCALVALFTKSGSGFSYEKQSSYFLCHFSALRF